MRKQIFYTVGWILNLDLCAQGIMKQDILLLLGESPCALSKHAKFH